MGSGGVEIRHNTLRRSFNNGLDVTTTVIGRVIVDSNLVTNNGLVGIDLGSGTSNNFISNNTASGNTTLDCSDQSTGGPAGTPKFGTQNSWTSNTGGTDDPDGICPPPT